jgi:hypothetical protein
MAGREESPDTVLSHQEKWATRLVTPGGRFGRRKLRLVLAGSLTESATENIPPAKQHGGIAQENLRDVFDKLVSFGKGEKVG